MTLGRILLVVAALVGPQAVRAEAKRLRIAVLDIRALATDVQKAELLNEIALTEAASMGNFDVIGKSDINAVIGFEKQKQVMGCGDDSTCLAEIGGALGVDFILVGSLGTIGDLFRLDLKLVDAKKARVRARVGVTVEGKESKLVAAVQKAVRDLLTPLVSSEPPPPVAAQTTPPAKEKEKAAPKPDALKAAIPLPPPPVMASKPASTGVSTSASTSRRTWAYVTGGTGLALLAGGAVFGLQARSALDAEKKAAASGDLAAYDSNKSKVKSSSTLADVFFLGGAAGVGVGTWLFFTSRPAAVALDVAPLPGGAFASISGGF
jgi:TolB-like protein